MPLAPPRSASPGWARCSRSTRPPAARDDRRRGGHGRLGAAAPALRRAARPRARRARRAADGSVAKSGGKVIKNVAGYDLGKLMTGAFGTLGAIVQVAVRLHPRPRARPRRRAGPTTPPRSLRRRCARPLAARAALARPALGRRRRRGARALRRRAPRRQQAAPRPMEAADRAAPWWMTTTRSGRASATASARTPAAWSGWRACRPGGRAARRGRRPARPGRGPGGARRLVAGAGERSPTRRPRRWRSCGGRCRPRPASCSTRRQGCEWRWRAARPRRGGADATGAGALRPGGNLQPGASWEAPEPSRARSTTRARRSPT